MNWTEFCLARLHMAEDRIGAPLRAQDRAENAQDEQSADILRSRGMVG